MSTTDFSKQKTTFQNTNFRYYSQIGMMFVALLLTANVIGEKPLVFGPIILPAGLLLFPITYLLGDLLTEVYGFGASRRVIWMGMACNLFMALMCHLSISLPALPSWTRGEAYAEILGTSSRLMAISVFTYFIGEFANAYIVAKLKIWMKGRLFWARALCGSWIGEGIETSLFIPLAFYGTLPNDELLRLAGFFYSFKVCYALCAMPLLNYLVNILKRRENLDIFDSKTNFNPFLFS
jgi:queuosine precursor transporter